MKTTLELLGKDALTPHEAAEKLVTLSVQYASLVSELARAEVAYNKKLRAYLEAYPEVTAAKAQIHAKGGELYAVLRTLQAEEKGLAEVIRSLKRFVRYKEEEQKFSGNL